MKATIYGWDSNSGDYIADYEGEEIRIDLFSMGLVDDEEDDIHGRLAVVGQWDGNCFIGEDFKIIN